MTKQYQYVLVDGSSYLFRAYHALPPLNNVEGMPTGAIFGVLNMIKRLEQDYPGAHVIVVFDPKGGSFRKELYAEYKADRVAMPDDLAIQIPYVHQLVQALGLPLLIVPNYEADDVIASLVSIRHGKQVLISTLDKDLAQLVNDEVHIVNTMHNKYLDVAAVEEKFGVGPDKIRDLLALMGDKSDNVPGVPGVGPKTAAKWLNEYGTIENIIANQDALPGKVGEKFRLHSHLLGMSQQLVSLVSDMELAERIEDIKANPADTKALEQLYRELGFKKWLADLQQNQEISAEFTVIDSKEMLDNCIAQHTNDELVGLCIRDQQAFLAYGGSAYQLACEGELWSAWLKGTVGKCIVMHDVKQSWQYVSEHLRRGRFFDVMLAQYVLDSTQSNDIESICLGHLSTFVAQTEFSAVYGAYIAQHLYTLMDVMREKLIDQGGHGYFEGVEMGLMPILAKMEQGGVAIDVEVLAHYATELQNAMQTIESQAHELLGHEFNLASPKQLRKILFEDLNLTAVEKTPSGEYSTSESALAALKESHPLIAMIQKYRTFSKLYSTYALPLSRDAKEGRIYGQFNQAVTITGRLSSTNPNLQNIPIKTVEGRMIRSAFIAPEGWQFISADYSQVELRILAHFSKDAALLEAFEKGEDVHRSTAANVYGIEPDQVTGAQRRQAKAVNFGLIYGMGAHGLARQLDIGKEEAQSLIDAYFEAYPGVKIYLTGLREQAEQQGVVETVLGRKLAMPKAKSGRGPERQAALRAAVNAPMQGSASDMIKLAMIMIDKNLTDFDYKMTMQVHDELLFEVKESEAEQFVEAVVHWMKKASPLSVPVEVDAHIGDNWDETH